MTNSIQRKAEGLKAQREAWLSKQNAALVPAPSPEWIREPETIAPHPELSVQTVSILGGLIKYTVPVHQAPVQAPVQDNTLALATQQTVGELNTVIAGQSAELAQLRQAVLVLAQSAKSVETGITTVVDGIEVIKAQTKAKIRPFDSIVKELNVLWRTIIEDTMFFNHDARVVTAGRGLRSILSFGTAAPEAIHAAKKEIYVHIKQVKSLRDKMERLYEYASLNHTDALKAWVSEDHGSLQVNGQSWTILDAFKNDFASTLQSECCNLRGISM